jgi:3-oxoacyl-[acyl-carrier-protein] synthase II
MPNRRVVVTGTGLVTALGTGVEKNWKAMLAGTSGVASITRFDASGIDARIAAEVKDFVAEEFIDRARSGGWTSTPSTPWPPPRWR